ncbi:hypothetical protein [Streptomyces sp. NPDC002845]
MRPLAAAAPSDAERLAGALLSDRRRREGVVALLLLRYDGLEFRPIRSGWTVWRLSDAVMHAHRFTARTLRSWEATGGRGLFLVAAMSAAWGTVPVSGSKQVWSEIVLPPHEPPPADTEPACGTTRPAPA